MVTNSKLDKLLEPYHIGPVKTRNRIIKSGASMMSWHDDELHMNETTKAFYESVARGGVGLLIVESPTIDYPKAARWRERYRMDDDKYIQGMSELVEVIHKHGCPTFIQMEHDEPWQSPEKMVKCAIFLAAQNSKGVTGTVTTDEELTMSHGL
jgi:2,4-dienoyl-CoA reductase-like NADH-dependent reductase (Old Yellow Enzyme family)